MFSTEPSTIFLGLAVLAGLLASGYAVVRQFRSEQYVKAAVDYVQSENKRSVGLKRITELEVQLTELYDSYVALLKSHKKLRSRITMRENRAKKMDNAGVAVDSDSHLSEKQRLRLEAKSRNLI